jgi:AhpD family alkylhydroperoxidase
METTRIDYAGPGRDAVQAMVALERYVAESGLERPLVKLVKVRASQLNGCAYCIDMHAKDARVAGERDQRLYMLTAWREAPCYTPRERAALAWAEAVTRISPEAVSDQLYLDARAQFSEAEMVALTFAVVAINGWNRLAISFGAVPGSYQPETPKRGEVAGKEARP